MSQVEMELVFLWTCPVCRQLHYISPEIVMDEKSDRFSLKAFSSVTCGECKRKYSVREKTTIGVLG